MTDCLPAGEVRCSSRVLRVPGCWSSPASGRASVGFAAGRSLRRRRRPRRRTPRSARSRPRCVFVLAADEDAGRPYIVMELMPGATLDDLVRKRGPLPVEEAVAKILDVIEGLQEAHGRGLIHRDVKPSNCFVEENGRVKVG